MNLKLRLMYKRKVKPKKGKLSLVINSKALGFTLAKRFHFTGYLSNQDIEEEINLTDNLFVVANIKPWTKAWSMLFMARLRKRFKDNGYVRKVKRDSKKVKPERIILPIAEGIEETLTYSE